MRKEARLDTRIICIAYSLILLLAPGCSKKDLVGIDLTDARGSITFYLDIYESKTDIYLEDDKKNPVQTLEYTPITDLEYAKNNFNLVDANFDGYADLQLPVSGEPGAKSHFFIYSPQAKEYIYHTELSELQGLKVEAALRHITVDKDTGKSGIIQQTYIFHGNALRHESSECINANSVAEALAKEKFGSEAASQVKLLNSTDVRVQLAGASNEVGGDECTIFSSPNSSGGKAYYAVNQYGKWYIDETNSGDFVAVEGYDGINKDEIPLREDSLEEEEDEAES
ncbi:MAG: hypothetical protein FWG30_03570 [Eubacteriaceae bacterium]|nr:hypothetical protein [Eubacteriaceae bacterium]